MQQITECFPVRTEPFFQFQLQESIAAQDQDQRDDKGDELSDDGGEGSAGNAELGESEVAVDEEIIEDHIDAVGDEIIEHGGARIPDATQRGGNGACQRHGQETGQLDLEILGGPQRDGLLGRSHENDHGPRKDDADNGEDDRCDKGEEQALTNGQIGFFTLSRALVARDRGGNAGIHGNEGGHEEKLGLIGQSDSGQRHGTPVRVCCAADGADHHQVNHGGKLGEDQFHKAGPGDADDVLIEFTALNAFGEFCRDAK